MVNASTLLVSVGVVGLLFGIIPLPGTGLLFAVLVILAGVSAWLMGY
ncbi:MAG: hypothetical protein IH933_13275 [Euryarchaeota archaeon]|jgi:hypothetical protein|nr:hypothetical protein [Euryarchaeota archaeon]